MKHHTLVPHSHKLFYTEPHSFSLSFLRLRLPSFKDADLLQVERGLAFLKQSISYLNRFLDNSVQTDYSIFEYIDISIFDYSIFLDNSVRNCAVTLHPAYPHYVQAST